MDGHHLFGDPRQAEVGNLEGALFSHHEIGRLDVAVTVQPLAERMLHSQAKLIAESQCLHQVQTGRADPAIQVAALDQLEHDIRQAVKNLDRVSPHDIRMLAKLHP